MPTLLLLAASPLDQDRLRLGSEVKQIKQALERSRNRENWTIESNEATTVDDLRRALLDFHPTIVHFSGHGGGLDGLCFEDDDGYAHPVDAQPLASLFHHFKEDLKCVVLNACFSNTQAEIIQSEIDYVIGMCAEVEDDSATKFAIAFYDAVFAGSNFRMAFDLGCAALNLNKLPDSNVPVFMTGLHLTPTTLTYTALVPEVERVLFTYFNIPYADRPRLTTTGLSLRPIIKKHYGELPRRNIDKVQVLSMDEFSNNQWRVVLDLTAGLDREQAIFYLRIRDRRVLVEWEASVGLWSVPVKTYLALGSDSPVIARVFAELDDYYNYDFSDQQHRFQSIKLRTKTGQFLNGYVGRNTKVYNELLSILSDGNSHSLTLELVHITNNTNTPLIQKVLSKNWLYSSCEEAESS